jgi:hypothetical protein
MPYPLLQGDFTIGRFDQGSSKVKSHQQCGDTISAFLHFLLLRTRNSPTSYVKYGMLDRNLICTPIRFRETKSDYET